MRWGRGLQAYKRVRGTGTGKSTRAPTHADFACSVFHRFTCSGACPACCRVETSLLCSAAPPPVAGSPAAAGARACKARLREAAEVVALPRPAPCAPAAEIGLSARPVCRLSQASYKWYLPVRWLSGLLRRKAPAQRHLQQVRLKRFGCFAPRRVHSGSPEEGGGLLQCSTGHGFAPAVTCHDDCLSMMK